MRTPDRGTVRLTAQHAVALRTGTDTALPGIPGPDTVRPWTNREATGADHAPGRLAMVGAGVVAVKPATAWQAVGSQVTLPVRGDGLPTRMEPFVGELVADELRAADVDIRTRSAITSVKRAGSPDDEVRPATVGS
ncbi:FAD-dependent oxidoreductase [Streptomyces adustus]|uniref:FAD-dependent oxidoreductase n=1 Tax=Streptomyces adustus TaxID=1609272 RepID=UPI0035E2AEBD